MCVDIFNQLIMSQQPNNSTVQNFSEIINIDSIYRINCIENSFIKLYRKLGYLSYMINIKIN